MKVHEFIKWLEKQDQNLEVCFLEVNESLDYCWDGGSESYTQLNKYVSEVGFDDPEGYFTKSGGYITFGVER